MRTPITVNRPGEAVAVVSIVREYFHVGDRAPQSGLFRAVHSGHRQQHMVVVIRGDEFPPCRFCKDAAVFILVEGADYVAHDMDFAGLAAEQAL